MPGRSRRTPGVKLGNAWGEVGGNLGRCWGTPWVKLGNACGEVVGTWGEVGERLG